MAQEIWEVVWERVRAGRHTVVTGLGTLPPAPYDLQVLTVHCEAPDTRSGALDAALRHMEYFLGEALLPAEPMREPFEIGLRQRFFGDMPGQPIESLFVDACNQLFTRTQGRIVLAFETIDAADVASLETLSQILQRPGWLRLPLLLTVRGTPQGRVAELIYLLCHEDSAALLSAPEEAAVPDAEPVSFDWTTLPPEVLRVLRAGSVLGTSFEATLVAQLLEEPLGVVLEKLQWAADAGAPLADRGEGYFTLPAVSIASLQSRMLPSLLTFWHARLGELLSGARPGPDMAAMAPPRETVPRRTPQTAAQEHMVASPGGTDEALLADAASSIAAPTQLANYAELFEPARHTVSPQAVAAPQEESTTGLQAPRSRVGERPSSPRQQGEWTAPGSGQPGERTRAATHLQAAGRTEAAVEQYLAAVREAVTRGDAQRALLLIDEASKLLAELPNSHRRALLRVQFLLEKGRIQWHGALLGPAFTLQDALASITTAESALPPEAPPELLWQLAMVSAGICYDIGTMEALQQALMLLTERSRRLFNAGESVLAARLLNDQAAIYVRLGDPVRATHLLSESRQLFENRLRHNQRDVVAAEELAETHHLLARLPLHAPLRPGREAEAAARGVEHANAAAGIYQRLGQPHQLARVWETIGRLELQRGQLPAAQERLAAALELQRQHGDVTGLARSTAALADLFVRAGRLGDAIALLTNSIALNSDKGSPIGLAFNRRALNVLAQATSQIRGPEAEQLRGAVAEVEHRLSQAEAVLGRVVLPGETQ